VWHNIFNRKATVAADLPSADRSAYSTHNMNAILKAEARRSCSSGAAEQVLYRRRGRDSWDTKARDRVAVVRDDVQ
jgi:hypothetical protein